MTAAQRLGGVVSDCRASFSRRGAASPEVSMTPMLFLGAAERVERTAHRSATPHSGTQTLQPGPVAVFGHSDTPARTSGCSRALQPGPVAILGHSDTPARASGCTRRLAGGRRTSLHPTFCFSLLLPLLIFFAAPSVPNLHQGTRSLAAIVFASWPAVQPL